MEFAWKDEGICKLCKREDKIKSERDIRKLWKDCFHDTPEYEDFYFDTVYRNNVVYEWREKGMLHLNPYMVSVMGKQVPLHYIVGVATNRDNRRQGIMRRILIRALRDMYDAGEPFTYLMPAYEIYYYPFNFVTVSEEKKRKPWWNGVKDETIQYLSYGEFVKRAGKGEQEILFKALDKIISKTANVFAVHDKTYMDLLYEEKHCQNGDVILCFDRKLSASCCFGFFAYSKSEEGNVVEQVVFKPNRKSKAICGYLGAEFVEMKSFNQMIRVVNVEAFLNLFADCFIDYAENGKRLIFEELQVFGNNGIYSFEKKNGKIEIKKDKLEWNTPRNRGDVEMKAWELIEYVFIEHSEKVKTFFAEIV